MKIKISKVFLKFVESEKTGGLLLAFCTLMSIVIANSTLGTHYANFWQTSLGLVLPGIRVEHTIAEWINDGLMTVFFLLVGLEIERELYAGELSEPRNAMLPMVAAAGGMVVPAVIHFSLNAGTPTRSGFGIPMATDIAFSLGVLSLLGSRVPLSLKVVLTALAIIDDLGAILVICFFYVRDFSFLYPSCALGVFVVLVVLNRMKVDNPFVYLFPGVLMWLFMLKSGVHATITGVLLAFAIPFRRGDRFSPSYKTQHFLDKPVPYLIIPLFVLANTAIVFTPGWHESLVNRNTLGIFAGLLIGKPLGIALFSLIAVKAGLCRLPEDLNWRHVAGMGILGGIGFTMSFFIDNLAFPDSSTVQSAKMAILAASVTASAAGFFTLFGRAKRRAQNSNPSMTR